MPRLCYQKRKFSPESNAIIDQANDIIAEYTQQGYDLTLRQLYYQFVSRGLIENNMRSYKRLGSVINDARMAGLIDWDHITDRTRNLRRQSSWESPADIIRGAASSFAIDLWRFQKYRPEVWIEKDALIGVFERICEELRVPYFSCRGYTSQSEMWAAARRLEGYIKGGQSPVIFHFGDHDPSGIDMTRDITDRLRTFLYGDLGAELPDAPETAKIGEWAKMFEKHWNLRAKIRVPFVTRLALSHAQVQQYQPPPNPAKMTDSRAKDYVEQYGHESWELDALDPNTLSDLVRNAVDSLIDRPTWDTDVERENQLRAQLERASDRWPEIAQTLEDGHA